MSITKKDIQEILPKIKIISIRKKGNITRVKTIDKHSGLPFEISLEEVKIWDSKQEILKQHKVCKLQNCPYYFTDGFHSDAMMSCSKIKHNIYEYFPHAIIYWKDFAYKFKNKLKQIRLPIADKCPIQ